MATACWPAWVVCQGDWEMRGSRSGNLAAGPVSAEPGDSQEGLHSPCNRPEASNQGSQQPPGPSSIPGDVEGKTLKLTQPHREVLCAVSGLRRGCPAFTKGSSQAAVPFFPRESFPMILVANKVDLMHLRKITREQGKEMATKHNVGGVCVCVRACVCVCRGEGSGDVSAPSLLQP